MSQITIRQVIDIVRQQLMDSGNYISGTQFKVEMFTFRGKDWSALVSSDRGDNMYYLLSYDYTAEELIWRDLLQIGARDYTITL